MNFMFYKEYGRVERLFAKKALPDINWARLKLHMVIPARVELATYRLGGDRSILLSYGTIWYDKLLYTKKTVLATAA